MSSSPPLPEAFQTPNETFAPLLTEGEAEASVGNEERRTSRLPPASWWLMTLQFFSEIISTLPFTARIQLYAHLVYQKPNVREPGAMTPSGRNTSPFFEYRLAEPSPHFLYDGRWPHTYTEFIAVMSLITGLFTILTLGWWGSFSDRHGRRRMLGIYSLAQIISPLTLILVATYAQHFRGAYWFVIIEAVILGAVGGTSSGFVTGLAYLSDISAVEQRSSVFSIILGLMLAGNSIGLTLGILVLRTSRSLLPVFYLATALRIIHTYLVWFILPESVASEDMHRASSAQQEVVASTVDEARPLRWFKQIFFFLKPLSMLFPENASEGHRRDWSLTILVVACGTLFLTSPLAGLRWSYAFFKFGWRGDQFSRYFYTLTTAHVVFLVLIFPLAIKFAWRRYRRTHRSSSEQEPLLSDGRVDSPAPSMFNLRLARLSALVLIVSYLILPLAPTGTIFVLFNAFQSLGAGFTPVINSLAFELYTRRIQRNGVVESGRFFAALNLALIIVPTGSLIGPILYSWIYSTTIHIFSGTIFIVGAANVALVLVLLAFVRVSPASIIRASV